MVSEQSSLHAWTTVTILLNCCNSRVFTHTCVKHKSIVFNTNYEDLHALLQLLIYVLDKRYLLMLFFPSTTIWPLVLVSLLILIVLGTIIGLVAMRCWYSRWVSLDSHLTITTYLESSQNPPAAPIPLLVVPSCPGPSTRVNV